MWSYFYIVFAYINFEKSVNVNSISSSNYIKEKRALDCINGTLLSTAVCIPEGYIKGEVPEMPTVVNSRIEINNIREVNDKKMYITLDYYQELLWVDNRIITSFTTNTISVLNNILINSIWKPDLWIKNLFDFKLHSILEPTGGLIIIDKESCKSLNCTKGIKLGKTNGTYIWYNMEARATIYCNFYFLKYPMDTQYCEFVMDGAYSYPNIVIFSMELGVFGLTNKNSNTDNFNIEVTFKDNTNQTGIHGVIKLERRIFSFIIKYYLPCIAITTMSLISFLLSKEHIPVRVALLVTNFLTLTNILMAYQVLS